MSTFGTTTHATKTVLRRATAAGGSARIATTNETTSGADRRRSLAIETMTGGTSDAARETRANRIPPAEGVTIAGFLDRYYESHVQPEGLRDPVTIQSRLKAVKAVIGDLPVNALEKPADILRFKAAFRKGREVATVNRALSTLRAAINWGDSRTRRT